MPRNKQKVKEDTELSTKLSTFFKFPCAVVNSHGDIFMNKHFLRFVVSICPLKCSNRWNLHFSVSFFSITWPRHPRCALVKIVPQSRDVTSLSCYWQTAGYLPWICFPFLWGFLYAFFKKMYFFVSFVYLLISHYVTYIWGKEPVTIAISFVQLIINV